MVYSLNYRRPAYVSSSGASVYSEKSGKADSLSSKSSCPYGIPEALSFDRVISGGTCPPATTRDFMNFLIYIEHAAENLQFFLWYRDYVRRFSELPPTEQALAPVWTAEQEERALAAQAGSGPRPQKSEMNAMFKGTDFDPKAKSHHFETGHNPFNTPPRTPNGEKDSIAPSATAWTEDGSTMQGSGLRSYGKKAADAFEAAGQLQPFTIRPFQEEISRVISIYIGDGGARQLNLSSKERNVLLEALSKTTHPSAFRSVISTVEWSLRHQAHPNFIRWTICNGNRPRVLFARGLGIGGIVGGLAAAIVLTLSSVGRGWRALSAIGFFIGIATLFAAIKGMCVVLHGMHHRHLRPWELFADADDASFETEMKKDSFDTLGSSNSYEDEPWVAKYDKRNVIRKVFDREVWIQEPALRQIQDTIFIQAIAVSLILSAVAAGVFVALPKGGFF